MKNSVSIDYINIINTVSSLDCVKGGFVRQIGNLFVKRN